MKYQKILAFFILHTYIVAIFPLESFYAETSKKSFEKFHHYIEIAQHETQEYTWNTYASFGKIASLALWEQETLLQKEKDVTVWEQHLNLFLNNLEKESQKQLLTWKIEQLLQENAKTYIHNASPLLEEIVQSKNEEVLLNQNDLSQEIEKYLRDWERENFSINTLLNTEFETLSQKEKNSVFTTSIAKYSDFIAQELKNIYTNELQNKLITLVYEKQSLHQQNTSLHATNIVENIITNVENTLETPINNLFKNLSTTILDEDTQIALNIDNWLESFTKEFNDALGHWENAEENFLAERLLWETSAESNYANSLAEWDRAYLKLQTEKENWFTTLQQNYQEATKNWQIEEKKLLQQIEQTQQQFEQQWKEKEVLLTSEFDIHFTIFTQNKEILLLTIENFEAWYKKNYNEVYSFWENANYTQEKIKYVKSQKQDEINQLQQKLANLETSYEKGFIDTESFQNQKKALEQHIPFYTQAYTELENWFSKIAICKKNTDSAAEKLVDFYAIQDFSQNELFSTMQNPLENELQIVKNYIEYWEHEKEIAIQVESFAKNNSATTENFQKALNTLENAKKNYALAEENYYAELEKLKIFENYINETKNVITRAKTSYENSLKELENAKTEYSEKLQLASLLNQEILEKQIADTSTTLLSVMQQTNTHENFFSCLEHYSQEKKKEDYKILLQKIISDTNTPQEIEEKIIALKKLQEEKRLPNFSYKNYIQELIVNYVPYDYQSISERLIELQSIVQDTDKDSFYEKELATYHEFLLLYWENYLIQKKETIAYILLGDFQNPSTLTLEEALQRETTEKNYVENNSLKNTTLKTIEQEITLYRQNITQTKMENLIKETYKNYSLPTVYALESNAINTIAEKLKNIIKNTSNLDLTTLVNEFLTLELSNKNITLYETTALYQILKSKILQKYSLENCKKNIFIDDTVEDVEKLEKNKEKLQVEFQKIYENYTNPINLFEILLNTDSFTLQQNIINLIVYDAISYFNFSANQTTDIIKNYYISRFPQYDMLPENIKTLIETTTKNLLAPKFEYLNYETEIMNFDNSKTYSEQNLNDSSQYFLHLLSLNKASYTEEELTKLTEYEKHLLQDNAVFVSFYNQGKNLSPQAIKEFVALHTENFDNEQLLLYALATQNPFANNFFYAEKNFSLLQSSGKYYLQNSEMEKINEFYSKHIAECEKNSIENSIISKIKEEQEKLQNYQRILLESKNILNADFEIQALYSKKQQVLDEEIALLLEAFITTQEKLEENNKDLYVLIQKNPSNLETILSPSRLDSFYSEYLNLENTFFYQDFVEETIFKDLDAKLNLYRQSNLSEEEKKENLQELESLVATKENLVSEKEKAYLQAMDSLQKIYTEYNSQIDNIHNTLQQVETGKFQQRVAQEIFDWISSIYLQESTTYSLKQKSDLANAKLVFFKNLQTKLQEKNSNNSNDEIFHEILENYQKSYTDFYLSKALQNDIYKEILSQEMIVKEQENLVKKIETSLVTTTQLEDLPFSVQVAKENLLQEDVDISLYFNNQSEIINYYDTYEYKSKAEIDTLQWIQSIFMEESKGKKYFYEISLAAFYLLQSNSQEENSSYTVNNFYSALQNYQGVFHNTDILQYFSDSFEHILLSHYNKIMQNETTKKDLQNYLLFRDTTLRHLNLGEMENNLIKHLTLQETMKKISNRCDSLKEIALAFGITSASNAAIAALLWFNPIAVAYYSGLSVAALLTTTDSLNKKNKLEEINKDLLTYSTNYDLFLEKNRTLETTVALLHQEYNHLEEKKQTLHNLLNTSSNGLSYETFIENLNLLLEIGAEKHYFTTTKDNLAAICTRSTYQNADIKEMDSLSQGFRKILNFLQKEMQINTNEMTTYLTSHTNTKEKETIAKIIQLADSSEEIQSDYYTNLLENLENQTDSLFVHNYYPALLQTYKNVFLAFQNYQETTLPYEEDNLKVFSATLQKIVEKQKEQEKELLYFTLSKKYENFSKEKNQWEIKMQELFSLSQQNWNKSLEKFENEFSSWKNNFSQHYQIKSSEWQENYNSFLEKKKNWILEQYLFAADASTISLTNDTEQLTSIFNSTDRFIQSAKESFYQTEISPENIANSVLENSELFLIEKVFNNHCEFIPSSEILYTQKKSTEKMKTSFLAQKLVTNMNNTIKTLAAQIATISAEKHYEAILESIKDTIFNENAKMHQWQENLVLPAGYTISQNTIYRDAIIDATVLEGTERKRQYVHFYQDYVPQAFSSKINFSQNLLKKQDEKSLQSLLKTLHWEVKDYLTKIFGDENEKQEQIVIKRSDFFDNNFIKNQLNTTTSSEYLTPEELKLKTQLENKMQKESLTTEEIQTYNNLVSKNIVIRKGDFGKYLGFAPYFDPFKQVSKNSNKEEFIFAQGSGEIGLIMKDFQWNQLITNAGLKEFAKPSYELRLWDDTDSWLEAPTIRDITNIALTTISTLTTGGFLNGFINLSDDLIFSLLDAAGNYKTTEEIGKNLGKQLFIQASSSLLGSFSSDSNMLDFLLKDATDTTKILVEGGKSFLSQYGKTVATSALSSVNIDDGNLSFDTENFLDTIFSGKALGTALGSGITSSLNQWNLGSLSSDGTYSKVMGFSSSQIKNIKTFNTLTGNLAQNALSFTLDGETSFNIINSADFNFGNTGLFAINLSKNGITGKLSTEGTNLSYSSLSASINGIKNWQQNNAINNLVNSAYNNNQILANALRAQYGFGTIQEITQLKNFILGKDIIRFTSADNFYGHSFYDNGTKIVSLKTPTNWIETGILLSHESFRNGITDSLQNQETIKAVEAHTEFFNNLAKDSIYTNFALEYFFSNTNIQQDYVHNFFDKENFSNYVAQNYDSSQDYWKLLQDGTILYDGKKDVYNENDQLIYKSSSTTLEESLIEILVGKNASEIDKQRVRNLMKDSFKAENKALYSRDIWMNYGNTIATELFAYHYDESIDQYIQSKETGFFSEDIKRKNLTSIQRYYNLLQAKTNFYEDIQRIVDSSYTFVSQYYQEDFSPHYKNYNGKHFGIDLIVYDKNGKISDAPITAGIPGKIIYKTNTENGLANGNSVYLEYGYMFENKFLPTGLYGEYLHLANESSLEINSIVSGDTVLGIMGNTGSSTNTHLHYSVYSLPNNKVSPSTLAFIFGEKIQETKMTNATNTKTVYNPYFFVSNYTNN